MEVEEAGSLMKDGFLKFLLGWRVGREIADAPGGGVILGKGIHKTFANFGCFVKLSR